MHNLFYVGKATTTLSKVATANLPFPLKHSKLQMAECPVGIATAGLYHNNRNDTENTDDAMDSSKISAIIHNT